MIKNTVKTDKNNIKPIKKMAIVNDLSGFGRCSLSVSIPIVSALGIEAVALPTSILSNHTAYPFEYKYDFTKHLTDYIDAWDRLKLHFDGILTGYMNYKEQSDIIASFIDRFKDTNTLVFVDPAFGDMGAFYRGFDREYVGFIRDKLIQKATVIKPNITEACFLTEVDYEPVNDACIKENSDKLKGLLSEIIKKLKKLSPGDIIITGLEFKGRIYNILVNENDISYISSLKKSESRPGTGDVFSSIIASLLLLGVPLKDAVKKADSFIGRALLLSDKLAVPKCEGVCFERFLFGLSKIGAGLNR